MILDCVLFNHREEAGEKMEFSRQVLAERCLFSNTLGGELDSEPAMPSLRVTTAVVRLLSLVHRLPPAVGAFLRSVRI